MSNGHAEVIVFSSTDYCPACDAVKKRLVSLGITFTENTNPHALYSIAQALHISGVPVVIAYSVGNGEATRKLLTSLKTLTPVPLTPDHSEGAV